MVYVTGSNLKCQSKPFSYPPPQSRLRIAELQKFTNKNKFSAQRQIILLIVMHQDANIELRNANQL